MKIKTLLVLLIIALIALDVIFFSVFKKSNTPVVGNKDILNEIDRLLLPVDSQNITEKDFGTLTKMVRSDKYASGEVNEIVTLAKYKEYAHIGHGLGSLYQYVKTGQAPVCPGHLLSHYYVFLKHGEKDLAEENLNEVENLSFNNTLFTKSLNRIYSGNTSTSETEISQLADAPCLSY
ncbi:hypothetical protein KW787_01835 [Candidatus Pacearchaeota archaeon]|nr:hypothetical protein [Candidatus Pacearchaeota archaeon]